MKPRQVFKAVLVCVAMTLCCIETQAVAAGTAGEPLTGKGKRLAAQFTKKRDALRQEIFAAMPIASPEKLAAYLSACKSEKTVLKRITIVQGGLAQIRQARGLVEHAQKKWIGDAEKGLVKSRETLEKATTDEARTAAEQDLEKWQKNLQEGQAALKERQAALDNLQKREPLLLDALKRAENARSAAKAKIQKALGELGSLAFLPAGTVAAYMDACATERDCEEGLAEAQKNMGKVGKAHGLVGHAKNKWIKGADKGIEEATAKLKDATSDADRAAAQKELEMWQKNREEGVKALKERQALLVEALAEEPVLKQAVETAKAKLADAKATTLKSLQALGLSTVLENGQLDDKLMKFVILTEATPEGLARFAQKSSEDEALVQRLLSDAKLMKQMMIADGAADGHYGRAMKIYTEIQKTSPKAKAGTLQRLALAVSLQHAKPVSQRNPDNATDAPKSIDPVKRYLNYEKAFLAGELDPAFKDFSVWEYRYVIYGSEPDEFNEWGRQMLRNYRPDHIMNPDYNWRYVAAVRTDVPYRFGYEKDDLPELQFYQNILMNGGVCGRRAFFGRFMLRAFGIPTTARPQPGHAALLHWTPKGWIICFGAGWGSGWTKTQYDKDVDFLATTQARENPTAFLQVKRAQWIGDVFGEERVFGLHSGIPGFWYSASLNLQRTIIEAGQTEALAAVGEELGEANDSDVKYAVITKEATDEERKIIVDDNGVITIPAAACSTPEKSTRKILFTPSNLGGKQLIYNRVGKDETFSYIVDTPAAGVYELTARVVTPTDAQRLLLTVNNAEEPVIIDLPFTVGLWETSKPVGIRMVKGKNELIFSRGGEKIWGLAIKEFTLTPLED